MSYEDTLRQYLEAAIPSRSVSPIPLERDQETPPYEGTDETQQTLARLLGPLPNSPQLLPNSPQLQEPPSLPPPFDRLPDTSAWVASRTDQQPPLTASSGFLANAPRSLSDAEQFADMSPAEIDLRRLYGPTAKIGLGDLMRMRTAHGEGLLSALAQQRAIAAREAQSQAAQREQQMTEDFFKMDTQFKDNPEQWDQQMAVLAAKGNPHARFALEVGDKQLRGEYAAVADAVQTYYPDFAKRYQQNPNSISKSEFKAITKSTKGILEKQSLAKAESQELGALEASYKNYLDNKAPMTPGDPERLLELRQKAEKRELELTKLRADIKKTEMPAGTDHTVLGRIHQSLSGGLPWEQGTRQTQDQALEKYSRMYVQARMDVQLGAPPPLAQQSNYYPIDSLKRLSLDQTGIKGKSEGELRSGPYRQLDDKEKDAVVQYNVAEKTVETMNRVASSLITAKTPKQAFKQKIALETGAFSGSNPLAKAYKADLDSFSSRMARLVEVGVLTNTDVTRWSQTFGSFGDTVGSLQAKQALFAEIQNETRRLLAERISGVPSEKLNRSKLDVLLSRTDQFTSVDRDWETLTQ